MDLSNVILDCPKCGRPTRVAYKYLDITKGDKKTKKKTRVCKKCKQIID